MTSKAYLTGLPGWRRVEFFRALFLTFVLLDIVLLGTPLVRLIFAGREAAIAGITHIGGTNDRLWWFAAGGAVLVLCTAGFWYAQARMMRGMAATIELASGQVQRATEEVMVLVHAELVGQGVPLEGIVQLCAGLRQELASRKLPAVPSMTGPGSRVVFNAVRTIAITYCKRVAPQYAMRMEKMPNRPVAAA